jgi:hypothetical protein
MQDTIRRNQEPPSFYLDSPRADAGTSIDFTEIQRLIKILGAAVNCRVLLQITLSIEVLILHRNQKKSNGNHRMPAGYIST